MLKTICPNCSLQVVLEGPDQQRHAQVECPRCKAAFLALESMGELRAPELNDEEEAPDFDATSAWQYSESRNRRGKSAAAISIARGKRLDASAAPRRTALHIQFVGGMVVGITVALAGVGVTNWILSALPRSASSSPPLTAVSTHPESPPGYHASPDGKDVGPGASDERWRTTPELQEQLKETKQGNAEALTSAGEANRAAADTSRERQSADVFLRHGGNVVLWTPEGVSFRLDKPGQAWPPGEWSVREVNVNYSASITNGDLAPLRDFPRLAQVGLASTRVTTAALLDHIKGKPVQQLSLQNVPTTSADAARLAKIKTLTRIFVANADWGDDDVLQLVDLPRLRRLNLYSTKITDRSLEHLGRLPHLTELYVAGTKVTDAGLAALQPCKTLRILNLSRTLVTADGVEKLRQALPECQVTAEDIQE